MSDPLFPGEPDLEPPDGMLECWECQYTIPNGEAITCSNPNCGKTLCDLCYHTCDLCGAPLCYRCATQRHVIAGMTGLCKACQDKKEINTEDDDDN